MPRSLSHRHNVVSMTALNPTLYYLPAYIESQRLVETDVASMVSPARKQVKSVCLCCDNILFQKCLAVCPSPLEIRFFNQNDSHAARDLHLEEEVRQEKADETQSSDNLDGDAFCALRSRGSSNLSGFRNVGDGGRALALSQTILFHGRRNTAPCACEITLDLLLGDIIRGLGRGSNRCGDIGVILVFGGALGWGSVATGRSVLVRRGVSRRGNGIRSLFDLW